MSHWHILAPFSVLKFILFKNFFLRHLHQVSFIVRYLSSKFAIFKFKYCRVQFCAYVDKYERFFCFSKDGTHLEVRLCALKLTRLLIRPQYQPQNLRTEQCHHLDFHYFLRYRPVHHSHPGNRQILEASEIKNRT